MKTRTSVLVCLAGAAIPAIAAPNFGAPTALATSPRPSGIAAGDWDGDGAMDMAVSVDTPDRILLLMNDGAGNLTPGATIFTGAGTGAGSLVAADFNLDGTTDIAVALQNVSSVRIYTNTAGNFALGAQATTGGDPRRLTAADFDGDGDMDLATGNRDSNSVSVIRNDGGALTTTNVAIGGEPRGLSAGDITGDGLPELFASDRDARAIRVLNNAAGVFSLGAQYSVGGGLRPDGSATADLDGDGDIDLAVAVSEPPNAVAVFTNNAGVFSGPTYFNSGGLNPDSVVIFDTDADGDMDIAVTNQDSGTVGVLENTGGAFGAPVLITVGTTPGDIIAADFNGDTMPDLANTNRDSNTTTVMVNANQPPINCDADLSGSTDPNDPAYGVPDGVVDASDFFYFLDQFAAGNLAVADLSGSVDPNDPAYGVPDGVLDTSDFFFYLDLFVQGCE